MMKNSLISLIALALIGISSPSRAGQTEWTTIAEIQWSVNMFRVVLSNDIDTTCRFKNVVGIMDPSMDPNIFDVRPELSYKTTVAQLTAAYHEGKQVRFFFRDDAKRCAFNSVTIITGFNVKS